jgi:hypothetical protein
MRACIRARVMARFRVRFCPSSRVWVNVKFKIRVGLGLDLKLVLGLGLRLGLGLE